MLTNIQEIDLALVDLTIEVERIRAILVTLAPLVSENAQTHHQEGLNALRDEISALAEDVRHIFNDNALPYIEKGHMSRWLKVAQQESAARQIPTDQLTPRSWQIDEDEL